MKIHAILNAKAGTLIDGDKAAIVQSIEQGLEGQGNQVQVDLVGPEDIEAAMDRALAGNLDILVIGGGDGTIKAAATKLAGSQTALGIIPLGTLNRLAKDLKIPHDPAAAASVIGEGHIQPIDVAYVNGHIFLCTSLLGLSVRVAEQRQALRGKGLRERIAGYYALLRNFLTNRRRFAVEIQDGSIIRRARALSIAVSNNPFADPPNAMLTRSCVDGGKLALYLSKHRTGGALGWAIIRRILGKTKNDPEVDEFCTDSIVLRSRRSKVRVSNDGELEELATPLRYTIRPKSLRIVAPKGA